MNQVVRSLKGESSPRYLLPKGAILRRERDAIVRDVENRKPRRGVITWQFITPFQSQASNLTLSRGDATGL